MKFLHEYLTRWRKFINRAEIDRDLDDEFQFHLEMTAERNRANGMTAQAATSAARQEFGSTAKWKESIRYMWSFGLLESVMQDLRYATRSLLKTKGFTFTAILVLMLGIGSTTAIFSVVNAVMLRGLPFQNPERLVLLWGNVQRQKVERRGNSYPDYQDWKAQSTSFEGMAAYSDNSFTLTGIDEPERISGEWVSASYFELLGIAPIAGRTIRADEDMAGKAAPVALISEGLWTRRFGADPAILGKQLRLSDRAYTVIGVLPKWFRGLTDASDIWAPFAASDSAEGLAERGSRGFPALARLKPNVTVKQAQTEMDGISRRLEQAYPETNAKRAVEVAPLATETVGQLQTPLLVLLGAVALVLLIACANVANLLLARSETRRQEIAIRLALGAGRWRVFRQLVTESMLLSGVGATLGVILSIWAVQLLTKTSPITLPTFIKPSTDWTVMAFAVGISALVGLMVGLIPALQCGKQDLIKALKESGSQSGDGAGRQRFRGALVVAEVALAMTLLVGAGLLMRSFQYLSALHPGFDPSNTLTMSAALPRVQTSQPTAPAPGQTPPDARTMVTGRQILQRIKGLPSVVSASVASDVPLGGGSGAFFYSAEGQSITDAQTKPRAYIHRVSPEFFTTIGAPVIAGRTFTDSEIESRAPVVVVTDNLTGRFWPGQSAIGKRIKSGDLDSKNPWWTIIGVVHEMKYRALPDNPTSDPDVFLPFSDSQQNVAILIRSSLDPSSLSGAARAAVHEVDPSITVYQIATITERFGQAIEQSRFASWMMTVFAGLALALASIGLYGVMSYTVKRRTRELGVRIAIGASPGAVKGIVVSGGMKLVAIGIAIGLVSALGLTRMLNSLLFGIGAMDPTTLIGVATVLTIVAFVACYLPARRASRIDPVTALRSE